ncbi:phosphate ABC transporter substrate-binding protein [Massilia glaciei]|nr:phosphate ABC transporter substrate-binding protein [Massilia glaciei]
MRRAASALATLAAALALLALGACGNEGAGGNGRAGANTAQPGKGAQAPLRISGSNTIEPLVGALAERFQALYPAIAIEVTAGGSRRGIADVRGGVADIGMVSRNLNDAEQDVQSFPIARDGVGLIVHRDNPVRELSGAQVSAMYTGGFANWRQVGGGDAPIIVYSRPNGRSSLDQFLEYFKLDKAALRAHKEIGDNAPTIAAVAAERNAIAFVSLGEAEIGIRGGAPIRLLVFDGVAASAGNVRNGDYAILRPLMLVTKDLPQGDAKKFIDFCLSAQATDLVRKFGFIPYMD